MKAVISGLICNYQVGGGGPVMLMLHGWAGSSMDLEAVSVELEKDFKVVRLDLPGFGASDQPKEDWGLKEYADFTADFLDKLNLKPAVIVAHSNGAGIALKGLSSGTLDCQKLIILAGAGIRNVTTKKKRLVRAIGKTGKPFLMILPEPTRKRLRASWYARIGSEMLLVPSMEGTFKKTVSEDVLALSRLVDQKTLLIYGEKDEATPPLFGRLYFENMLDARLEVLPGAGHFVFDDEQERVVALIKEFAL